MSPLRTILALLTTLAVVSVASIAMAHSSKVEPADKSNATALITYELRGHKFFKLPHPYRVSILRPLAAPPRSRKAAHAAYHYTCTHATYWFIGPGGYHRYIGYGTCPWVHTHYYEYSGAGGVGYNYRTGPC